MLQFPKDLSNAKILIVNDDSIHAEGIKVLEEIVREITPNIWVVAPEDQHTGSGHSLTLHMPLRLKKYDDTHYSVQGTPTDATLMGVQQVMQDFKPDLVLSGINHGQNNADDVTYSGTIAAAMEAVLMEIPAIAISQRLGNEVEVHDQKINWDIARKYIPEMLDKFRGVEIESKVVINVNIPLKKEGLIPELKVIHQGHYTIKDQAMVCSFDPRGRPYFWIGSPPERDTLDITTDVGVLNEGHVSITPLSLDLTHEPTIKVLGDIFR